MMIIDTSSLTSKLKILSDVVSRHVLMSVSPTSSRRRASSSSSSVRSASAPTSLKVRFSSTPVSTRPSARSSARRSTTCSQRSFDTIACCTRSICVSSARSVSAMSAAVECCRLSLSTTAASSPKRSASRVSVASTGSGDAHTSTTACARPERPGRSSCVSAESWKGAWLWPSVSAVTQRLRASSPRLIRTASRSRSPVACDRLSCSEPPRSARQSVERSSRPSAERCVSVSSSTVCARDERSFIAVAARRLARSAVSSRALASSAELTRRSA
mmetsp:Transcript_25430/g.65727  ORF Transcript_25430/g.65727 Transcript_25430/m.65727 type:complete len:273 (+) Transcript_25430:22-840(+)